MADYGNRTVGLETGNPHYYGESIWDLMRPSPGGEEDLQQNLYGAGAIGQEEPTNVTEGRSPFGQMLQGIGILGPPSPRALTPFEQFIYQRGAHQKGEWDQQTQQQSLENIARKFSLANQVTRQTGGAALPPEVANLFNPDEQNSLSAWGQHFGQMQNLSDQAKQVDLQKAQTQLEIEKKNLEFGIQDREEARQQNLWNKKWSSGPVADARREYEMLVASENKEIQNGTMDPAKHNEYVVARNRAKQRIVAAANHIGIPGDQLTDYMQPEDPLSNVLGGQTGQANEYNAANPGAFSTMMNMMNGVSQGIPPR